MRYLVLAALAILPAWAAVQKEPSDCSGRPCVYTVTCDNNIGRPAEIQEAVDDSWLGDTIRLQAGCVWTVTGEHIRIFERQGSSGYLTITSTEEDKLPSPGTRITPAYKPLMPVLQINTSSKAAIAIAGAVTGAHHIRIRGIYFTVNPAFPVTQSMSRGPLLIGNSQIGPFTASADFELAQVSADADAGQPVLRVTNSSWAKPGLTVGIGSLTARKEVRTIQSVDSGMLTFSENLAFAHTAAQRDAVAVMLTAQEQQPTDIIVQHCVFGQDWQHQIVRMISLHGRSVIIRDNFIEGAMVYATDAQGIIGWNGTGPFTIENNYIQASSENLFYGGVYPANDWQADSATIRFNYLPHIPERERVGPWAPNTLVFRGRHIHPTSGAAAGFYIATATGVTGSTEPAWPANTGETIEDNAGSGGLVWKRVGGSSSKPLTKNNLELKTGQNFTIQHNVFDWMYDATAYGGQETNINIKAENTNQASTACDAAEGFPACYGARTTNVHFLNNLIRGVSGGIKLIGGTRGIPAASGGHVIRDNLFLQTEPISRPQLAVYSTYSASDLLSRAPEGTIPWSDYRVEHNTFFTPFKNTGGTVAASRLRLTGNNAIRGNIFTRGAFGFKATGTAEGSASLALMLGCDGVCGDERWSRNIVLGAPLALYPPNSIFTNCPTPNACPEDWGAEDPQYGHLFRDVSRGKLDIAPTHAWASRQPEDAEVGADTAQLPQIRDLSVTPTDRMALFQWNLTEPIRDIPCTVEVNLSPDFEGAQAGELSDIAAWHGQDADDADRFLRSGGQRMFVSGHTVNLTPSTTYYYRLQCGGDTVRGKFVTAIQQSGTVDYAVRFPAWFSGAAMLEYGPTYSRASNSILESSGVSTEECSDGQECTATFTAPAGTIQYFRVGSGDVQVVALTQ